MGIILRGDGLGVVSGRGLWVRYDRRSGQDTLFDVYMALDWCFNDSSALRARKTRYILGRCLISGSHPGNRNVMISSVASNAM